MTEIRPQAGPQETWLESPADIAVYGGAAFGGKTFALLMEAMRHTDNPGFGAVIFRRTSPQITNEGGLWDSAGQLYPLAGATPLVGSLDWRFPSGANVGFRHLQHEANKYNWQGTQVPLLGFDELTHFSESQFWYMISRNRSTCGVRPYVRATTNPEPGWVKKLLGPWVDRKHPMYPTPSGTLLYFVRVQGELVWATHTSTLSRDHPGLNPKSITFVRSTIWDNRIGMAKDPDYLGNLQAQSPVERARLLDGDWDVVNEGLVYPDFGSCVVEVEDWPDHIDGGKWGGIDWGWNNPFAALEAVLDGDDVLWVHWERHGSRITLTEHSNALRRPRDHHVRWFGDPAGADQIGEFRASGHDVVPCVHMGQRPLENGIALVHERIRTGRLKVRGTLGSLIDEAGKHRYEKQTGKQGHEKTTEKPLDQDNHALAALRYLVVGIDRRRAAAETAPPYEAPGDAAVREKEERDDAQRIHRDIDNDIWWEGN